MKEKTRVPWLDYVRFFSIFLVILYHTPPFMPVLDGKIVINLRIPLFFCISGFLFNDARYSTFAAYLKHRGRQIMVPYVSFFVIFYLLWLFAGRRLVGGDELSIPLWQPWVEMLKGDPKTIIGPFWYLSCLFTMQMLYYLLQRAVKSAKWLFAVTILLSMAAVNCPLENIWHVWNAMVYMPFYAFGNCFKGYVSTVEFSSARRTALLSTLAVLSMTAMAMTVGVTENNIINPVKIACGIAVLPAYIALSKWIAARCGRNRVIELVVVNGTVYLAFQNQIIGFIKVVLNRLCHPGVMDEHVWIKFLVPFVVMAAIYPFAWLIHHHAPWLLGKKKHRRVMKDIN